VADGGWAMTNLLLLTQSTVRVVLQLPLRFMDIPAIPEHAVGLILLINWYMFS